MLIHCTKNQVSQLEAAPDAQEEILSWFNFSDDQVSLNVGKLYVVYAVTFRANYPWYYVADETYVATRYPLAYPAPLFAVVDDRLSQYWAFAFIPDGRDGSEIRRSRTVISFREWTRDETFFERLVNGEQGAVEVFSKYKALLDLEFPNPSISLSATLSEADWLLCPQCGNAWETRSKAGLVQCPNCSAILSNPRFGESLEG